MCLRRLPGLAICANTSLEQNLRDRRLAVVAKRPLNAGRRSRQQPIQDVAHVALVVDRVALAAPEYVRALAQKPRAHGVKRRRGHRASDRIAE
jgi:hypothetical protein